MAIPFQISAHISSKALLQLDGKCVSCHSSTTNHEKQYTNIIFKIYKYIQIQIVTLGGPKYQKCMEVK